jgi:toxin ParE1/3/4
MRIAYHPHAEGELVESARYYETQVPSLGGAFLDAIEGAVQVLQADPLRWRILEADVRRYLLPRFPFAIYYRVLPDHIRILALKHHSRHPDYWRYRIVDLNTEASG